MELTPETFLLLWEKLVWPLIRLIFFIGVGLLVANLIEALGWTRKIALLSTPLRKLGNMSETAGASFSVAFASGVSANTMLSEAYLKGQISKKELVLANLFNSLPTYFLHLPTMFFIALPLLQGAAFIYIGLTFGAAIMRTLVIVVFSNIILPPLSENQSGVVEPAPNAEAEHKIDWKKLSKRFVRRLHKIIKWTVPIYIAIFFLHKGGAFSAIEMYMVRHLSFISWLTPEAITIITIHLAAELTAGIAAAGAFLQEGTMTTRDVIIALLVGNIISSPVRAIRHQFPYYAGIFQPKTAVELLIYNQSFRVGSLIVVGLLYVLFT